MPLVSYGCETWCVTLGKENWLRVCENKVLRKVFEAKSDEISGD